MSSNIGTPNNHLFPFGTNGKIVVLGVPILKHFRVLHSHSYPLIYPCKFGGNPSIKFRGGFKARLDVKWRQMYELTIGQLKNQTTIIMCMGHLK